MKALRSLFVGLGLLVVFLFIAPGITTANNGPFPYTVCSNSNSSTSILGICNATTGFIYTICNNGLVYSINTIGICGSAPTPTPTPTATPTASPTPSPIPTGFTSYGSAVHADSPIAFYPLNENVPTNTTLTDISGNGHNGTYGSGVSNSSGIVQNDYSTAALFPGGSWASTNMATVPYSSAMQPTTNLSVEAWVKSSAPSGGGPVVSYGSSEAWEWLTNGSNLLDFTLRTTSGTTYCDTTTTMTAGTSYYLAATYDGSNVLVYVNGSLQDTCATTGTITNYDTSSGLAIGGRYATSTYPQYLGQIQDVAIYGTTLSQARIIAHYTAGGGIAPTPTPVPSSTPTPTPSPSPTGTAVACATPGPLVNGTEYAPPFTPFSCSGSAWNQRLPVKPTNATWSSAVIAYQFQNGNQGAPDSQGNSGPIKTNPPGTYDVAHNYYYATNSDPLVNLVCTSTCPSDNGGLPAQIHVPAAAQFPTSNTDDHDIVIQCGASLSSCTNGTEIDLYSYGSSPTGSGPGGNWKSGDTITIGAAGNCGNWSTSSGFYSNYAVTAGDQCSIAGIMRANELLGGYINHALVMILDCQGKPTGSSFVFPVQIGLTDICPDGADAGPPLGGRLYYDNTCNATGGPVTILNFPNGLPGTNYAPYELTLLCELNQYGTFYTDDFNGASYAGGFAFQSDGGTMFYDYGNTSPYAALMAAPNNWTSQSGVTGFLAPRYFGFNGQDWNPDGFTPSYWLGHMHYADPCVSHVPSTC